MAHKGMDVYLNDHLAGAMFGSDLAEQIEEVAEGTPLGDVMRTISAEIEQDRKSLIDLMEAVGTSKNPVKQLTTWVAEKASRPEVQRVHVRCARAGALHGAREPARAVGARARGGRAAGAEPGQRRLTRHRHDSLGRP